MLTIDNTSGTGDLISGISNAYLIIGALVAVLAGFVVAKHYNLIRV